MFWYVVFAVGIFLFGVMEDHDNSSRWTNVGLFVLACGLLISGTVKA